jgi:hypothetical protein
MSLYRLIIQRATNSTSPLPSLHAMSRMTRFALHASNLLTRTNRSSAQALASRPLLPSCRRTRSSGTAARMTRSYAHVTASLLTGSRRSNTRTQRMNRDSVTIRDGNGYPKPETRWVFTPLGYEFGSIFILMGLLMGINVYPTGSWVRVCSYSTQTREPMGFLNPTKPSAYCHFI